MPRFHRSISLLLLISCTAGPGRPPEREAFRALCEPYLACDCNTYHYRDLDSCMTYHHASFAELFGAARAAGLHTDLACYLDGQSRPDDEQCLSRDAYDELHPSEPESDDCGRCNAVYGERQVGEPCLRVFAGGSDCAQGLLCFDDPGVCIDPCGPTPIGAPCQFGSSSCAPGSFCDFKTDVCRALAGPGEPCLDGECAEGLTCDRDEDRCVAPAALDERCYSVACAPGLVCLHADSQSLCRPIPGEGEPCDDECSGDLYCAFLADICVRLGALGDACDDVARCGEGLLCVDDRCEQGPGIGEPCVGLVCRSGLECSDGTCGLEAPRVCLD